MCFKKETQTQLFSCEFCEIWKNAFSYRGPPVAASGITGKSYGMYFEFLKLCQQ